MLRATYPTRRSILSVRHCYLGLAALLALPACAPQALNTARYTLDGRSFRVPARALAGMGVPSGRTGLDIEVGQRPLKPGAGVFLVSYEKAADTPEADYQLTLITYTCEVAASYHSVSYTDALHGTLTSTRNGTLSGTFYGTLPATATGGTSSTVKGSFKVLPPKRKH